jgi:DNA (cytosine-5)-methyltransferase 1
MAIESNKRLHLNFLSLGPRIMLNDHTFYEFFSGGGLARLGLGSDWRCILANDISPKKTQAYVANFGDTGVLCCDIGDLTEKSLPGRPILAWASFPCQDLSLAGNRMGLIGDRSGTFWGFWSAINKLKLTGRAPPLLVLENVCGLLTSNKGQDFREICGAIASLGYSFGAMVVDALHFLPHSRQRLFVVCTLVEEFVPHRLITKQPSEIWHSNILKSAVQSFPPHLQSKWIWWNLPKAVKSKPSLSRLISKSESDFRWHSQAQTKLLLSMMTPTNRKKVSAAKKIGTRVVGTIYKRKRIEEGIRIQRAEVRFDGVAGCLRTPSGGSSRQIVMIVKGKSIRTRLLSTREAARLMGVSETYQIPENYNDGYRIFGDGVAVPVVAHIAKNLLTPIAKSVERARNLEQKHVA